jgi:hypothetical protein
MNKILKCIFIHLLYFTYLIQILGDNHARGLTNELTRDYETQDIVKPGSTLVNLINTTPLK